VPREPNVCPSQAVARLDVALARSIYGKKTFINLPGKLRFVIFYAPTAARKSRGRCILGV